VLVTIDTLRADRLACYGSRTVETPALDRIAREGALAQHASVHVPLTRPSHVTIFTGLYPAEHGIRDNVSPALEASVPTLGRLLKDAGFRTAGFVSSIVVSSQSGLSRGFDLYSDTFDVGRDDARFLNTIQKRGDGPTAEAIAWLEARRAEAQPQRLFVWLHLYDPHDPYEPPEPYAARYADRPYDGEVAWSDELVGRLDGALERLGLRNDTLLVVTSDHGEGLGDHGEAVHGYFVYESTLHVPLLLRGAGIAPGRRLSTIARSVDLMPTFLDLLGVSRPDGLRLSGRSLAGALRGASPPPDEPTYAESLTPLLHFGWSDLRTLRDGRWKYIQAPRPELYDLRDDPGEEKNLVAEQPERAAAFRSALGRRLEAEKATAATPSAAAAIPPELLEQLGALGYVGAGGAIKGGTPGADPKDKLADYKAINTLMREGLTHLREKDPAGSAERFRKLIARGVESFEVHYYLARALVLQNRCGDAVPHFEAAIKRLPAYGAAYTGLAECKTSRGDAKGALDVIRRGEAANPKDGRLRDAEGGLWRTLEKPREAIAAYEAALPLLPKDALVRIKLGELYRDTAQLDKAIAVMREGIAIDPAPANYWNSLGMVLGGSGHLPEAEKAFREALGRDGTDAQYAYNLGLVLQRQGRPIEAEPFFRQALERNPRFAAARARLTEIGARP
jgi:arylsulfatase A-like enzyme/Tfp pilus assembly protein PilF